MFELFLVYAWLKIETITYMIEAFGIILMIAGVVKYILYNFTYSNAKNKANDSEYCTIDEREEARSFIANSENHFKEYTKWAILLIVFGVMTVGVSKMMPTQKEMSILVATGYTMKVIDSPEVQKMVLVAKGMANDWMDEKLKKQNTK